jgi:hypothetical protein
MLSNSDQKAIRAQVALYFKACHEADLNNLQQTLHPDVILSGYIKGSYLSWNRTQFIERIHAAEAYKHEPFLKEIISIEGTNDIAVVKTRVISGENTFIDYLSMMKVNEQWLIRYKIFTC